MKKFKIFVSGVQNELAKERVAVKALIEKNVLLRDYFEIFLFEDHPAKSKPANATYMEHIEKSDIYLGVLGFNYGTENKEGISPTEQEFRRAQETNKEILIYIKSDQDDKRDIKIQTLINDIKNSDIGYTYKRFNTEIELQNNIFESLINFLRTRKIIAQEAFDQSICTNATLNDIDEKKVRWFLHVAKENRNFPLPLDTPTVDVLTHLNLIHENKITNAVILLFGKNPQKYLLQAEIKCVQFFGIEVAKPFTSYQIYDGNLFEQIDKAVKFVLGVIKIPVIQQEHTAQVKRPLEIPLFAIEEAIVNAVAHRDYNTTAGVQVMCFADRIEILNSGSLPEKLTLKDLKKIHTSHPANPLIANVLYLADYIQRLGTGTLEMVKQCKNSGLPEPEFVCIRNAEFRTILARDVYTEDNLKKAGFNERQINVIKYLKEHEKITNTEYQKLFNIKKRQASIDLKYLEEKNIIERKGTTGKGTNYILKKFKGA